MPKLTAVHHHMWKSAGIPVLFSLTLALQAACQQQYLPVDALNGTAHGTQVINAELRHFIDGLLKDAKIPGLSLGVVHSGGVVEVEGFGRRSEDGARATSQTRFNIASCSKAFTASALGILMDDYAHGRNVTPLPDGLRTFDWHTKVQDILPDDWKLMDDWASQKASFQDILSHQSGLPGHDYAYTASDTPRDVVHRLRYLRPTFELRQKFQYNNLMYILASRVVALYSDMSFEDFVRRRIWEPLNMSSTTYNINEASSSGLLTHAWASNGRRIPNIFEQHPGASFVAAGAGGIISTVEDLTLWISMLLNEGANPVTNGTVLPPSVFKATTSGYIITSQRAQFGPQPSLATYGLGWTLASYRGHELLIHGGSVPGFSSFVAFFPSVKLGITILANGDQKHAQELAIIDRIAEGFSSSPGLAPPHNNERQSQDSVYTTEHIGTSQPEYTSADPTQIADFAGTYFSSGYRNFTLCDPQTSHTITACREVLDTFSKLEDLSAYNDTLYAVFDNIMTSHVRFRRLSNTTFRAQPTALYPNGYGADSSAFEVETPAPAAGIVEFIFEDDRLAGFGLNFGLDDVTMRRRAGGGIKETAEVWYEKARYLVYT